LKKKTHTSASGGRINRIFFPNTVIRIQIPSDMWVHTQ
jgi:hypothetical protein